MPTIGVSGRWMMFVDGENLTLRGQDLAKSRNVDLAEGANFARDTFLWVPRLGARSAFTLLARYGFNTDAVRAHYYTSVVGDDDKIRTIREALRALGFEPEVFKRSKGQQKSKGVDIALTKDMLSHAFMNNYDGALLIAGDGDYIPLVREVKRLGKVVALAFFEDPGAGLSAELRLIADCFDALDTTFLDRWRTLG